jgi:hypothetical protein
MATRLVIHTPDPHADLAGFGLHAARGLWLAVVALVLVLMVAGAPLRVGQLLAAVDTRSLAKLGLAPGFYARYLTVLSLASLAAHLAIAAYIFWRRSAHQMCLVVSFTLVTNGATLPLAQFYASAAGTALHGLANLIICLGLVTSMVLLYVFPDGRFVPGWSRWLGVVWAGMVLVAIFFPGLPLSLLRLPAALQVLVLLVWAGTGLFAQWYRYRHISSPIQRQQAKWAGLGLLAAVLGPLAYFLSVVIVPQLVTGQVPDFLYRRMGAGFFALSLAAQLVAQGAITLALVLFPVLFAIAILRYRLWDIDLLINRALVYGTLSALMALAYFTSVVLLQQVFQAITGRQESELVTVVSTLAIVALSMPLLGRVQAFIDRRFFRRKYDAAQTLAAFAAGARDEVGLEHLSTRLLEVVQATMQPDHVSLWLKTPSVRGRAPEDHLA